jgi:hypothetical protein
MSGSEWMHMYFEKIVVDDEFAVFLDLVLCGANCGV